MSNDIIQAQYDTLNDVARRFGGQAQANREMLAAVRRTMQPLQAGAWQGRGSTAFFNEMNSELLPALNRLVAALEQAQTITTAIARLVRQAEEEAARPFQGRDGASANSNSAGDGATAAPAAGADSAAMPTPMDTASIFAPAYMDSLIGLQVQGADSAALNRAMETLAGTPSPQQVEQALDQIAQARGVPRAEIEAQYQRYLSLRDEATRIAAAKGMESIPATNQFLHDDFMGSTTQLRYGQVVGDALGIDPVFGALLNPTGGLVGPGNAAVDLGDSALGYHGVVHDAAGYLYNYHNMGPGYNYLGLENRDTSSPLTGQQAGIQYWTDRLDSGFVESTLSNTGGTLLGVAEDVKTGVTKAIDVVSDGAGRVVDWFGDLFD
ncbi:MAG: WXG100 family type VII secretion target [Caldilineales bacterium]